MKMPLMVAVIVLCLFASCKEQERKQDELIAEGAYEKQMKSTFGNFIENAWNKGNMDSLKVVLDENFIKHINGIQIVENQSEMKANMNIYLTGFPDGQVSVSKIYIKNNHLFTNWKYTGTNTGHFGEYPATGKKVNIQGYAKIKFNATGKMIGEDVYFNELELLQQLGYTLNPPVLE